MAFPNLWQEVEYSAVKLEGKLTSNFCARAGCIILRVSGRVFPVTRGPYPVIIIKNGN